MVTLILGGARSGKTAFALSLAEREDGDLVYLATAEAHDQEMLDRIGRHRAERGLRWTTVEEAMDLPRVLAARSRAGNVVLVDCLTLWLSNLMLAELDVAAMTEALTCVLPTLAGSTIFVSNEVGLGIVPDNALARRFRDAQGTLNQRLATAASSVVLVAAGLPLVLKHADQAG